MEAAAPGEGRTLLRIAQDSATMVLTTAPGTVTETASGVSVFVISAALWAVV